MDDKTIKANHLIEDGKILQTRETAQRKYFSCKGSSGDVYDITYSKRDDVWTCTCPNVKHVDCYHIKAAKKLTDEIHDTVSCV